MFIQTVDSLHCKFGTYQKREAAGHNRWFGCTYKAINLK